MATEANKVISTVLRTSASGDTYYARSATVVGMGELLLFFGREFTASELYDYFTNARQLVAKRAHPWTNAERRQQSLQHHELVGTWGLGRKTPQGSADAKEVAAVAEAIRRGKAEEGKGRPVAAPPAEGDPPAAADGAPPAKRAPSDECWNWRGKNWRWRSSWS